MKEMQPQPITNLDDTIEFSVPEDIRNSWSDELRLNNIAELRVRDQIATCEQNGKPVPFALRFRSEAIHARTAELWAQKPKPQQKESWLGRIAHTFTGR